MAELRRVPPGRAGRMWLTSRLHSARLAADLLDRKLQVLRVELERAELLRERTRARWQHSWRAADSWGLRGAMTAGVRELRLARPGELARVEVAWATVMGVRYPAEANGDVPAQSPAERGPSSAALVEAATAYREAVAAGAAHAAADTTCRIIEAEIAETRRRVRAIAERWIPRLESRLARLRHELDETEREETFRRRWVQTATRGPRT